MQLKSFHDNFREEVDSLTVGESGCIAIKYVHAKKDIVQNFNITSGMMLTKSNDFSNMHFRKFKARVLVLNNHSTTIKENYQPLINCKRVAQCARVCNINKEVLRGGDKAIVDIDENKKVIINISSEESSQELAGANF